MANRNGTLTANTAATVLVQDCETVEVLNRDGAAEIWVSVDAGENPTVASEDPDVLCIPAVAGAARRFTAVTSRDRLVRLISTGTPTYSVTPL